MRGFVLVGIVLLLGTAAPSAAADEFQYIGHKKCRTCHKKELMGNQYGSWQDGPHAKAFETLKSDEAAEYAAEAGLEGPAHEADECVQCHATAFGLKPTQLAKKPLKLADGVQCESCHGPGSGYRKKKIMADRDRSVAKGLVLPEADTCTACHNSDSPAWDPSRYTLAGGTTVGFDFDQAAKEIAHAIPEDVKGHYIEIEKKLKAEKRARGEAIDDEEDED